MSTQPQAAGHDQVADLAHQIRRDIICAIANAGTGHPGGALGAAEIFAALYGSVMNHHPDRPDDPNRDRFVLSNGHICAGLYSALARTGYFPVEQLTTFRKINSHLQGHPARVHLPQCVETSSGPLGQGISVTNGLALAARLNNSSSQIFCLVGDGEMQEGQVWEALMTAAHYKLSRVTLLISYNGLQIDGKIDEVMKIDPLAEKLQSFGWSVTDIDGHDAAEVVHALNETKESVDPRPKAVILRTVMGKGVPYMEHQAAWHGGKLSREQAREALDALGPAKQYADFLELEVTA